MQVHFYSNVPNISAAKYDAISYYAAVDAANRLGNNTSLLITIPGSINKPQLSLPDNSPIDRYFKALLQELTEISTYTDRERFISKVHFEGNLAALNSTKIEELIDTLKSEFLISTQTKFTASFNSSFINNQLIDMLRRFEFTNLILQIEKDSAHPLTDIFAYIRKRGKLEIEVNISKGCTPNQIYQTVNLLPQTVGFEHEIQITPEVKELLETNDFIPIEPQFYARRSSEIAELYSNNLLRFNQLGLSNDSAPIIGIGASAYSLINGEVFANEEDVATYLQKVNASNIGLK